MKDYKECLEYLKRIQVFGVKLGLNNVQTLLAALDDPQKKYPSVVVAGSNGKGSVCAMLARIFSLHDYKAGLYTSPHLVRYEERIRVGEDQISRFDFCRLLSRLRLVVDELLASKKIASHPTHFEILTCLALLYFHEKNIDIAVLEVGMGGRFDATNVVIPKLAVITTISPEHQIFLGNTLKEIAAEKAGIIKSGIPVVCGVEKEEAYNVIRNKASASNSLFFGVFDQDGSFKQGKEEKNHTYIYKVGEDVFPYSPSLLGVHQGKNAAVAIAAAVQLSRIWNKLNKAAIIRGIESTQWEGRLEIISRKPLILIDGAHNKESAEALQEYIKENIPSPIVIVFAVMRDKDIECLARILFPLARKVILTRFPYFRAASPEEIRQCASEFQDRILLEPDPKTAVQRAVETAGNEGSIIVTGSLFLVGEIKKRFKLT